MKLSASVDSLRSLGLDSLRLPAHATELERRFEFRVDAELSDVETVEELAWYVRFRPSRPKYRLL